VKLSGMTRTFVDEARRRQIVECTIALVAERGYAAASLSAIAARAGISKAAVLYHFRDKQEVIAETVGHVLATMVAEVGGTVTGAGADPLDRLLAHLRAYRAYVRAHPTHRRVLAEGAADTGAAARLRDLVALVEAGQRVGSIRPAAPRVLALAMIGALDAVVADWVADPTTDLDAAGTELDTAILRMLAP
jgi:TetR/AcrR family transcriptional regulator